MVWYVEKHQPRRFYPILSSDPRLNPAVASAAALFCDGALTDRVLADVATMKGLPLLVDAPAWTGPDALTLAEQELAAAETVLRGAERRFANACRELGEANRRVIPSALKGGKPIVLSPERVRAEKSRAMGWLNTRRADLRRAEKRVAAARAALAVLAS